MKFGRSILVSRANLLGQLVLAALCALASTAMLCAQVKPAAKYGPDVQIGAILNIARPDYASDTLSGFGFYLTDDFARHQHIGIEAAFHQLYEPGAKLGIYERMYELGPRYVFHYGRLKPYAKFMIGRGIFQFSPDPRHPENGPVANLAYTIWAGGFGTDYVLRPSINLRADYEYQTWGSFPPHGLNPQVFSFGVAYHFH